MGFAKLHMVLLSPVHIGSGEELPPDEYFIQNGKLHVMRSGAFVRLPKNERERLLQRIGSKNFHPMEIGHVCARYASLLEEEIISTHSVSDTLEAKWQDNRSANQLQLNRMVHLPHNGLGYIPGSTIKGVFRTALLDVLLKMESKENAALQSFLKDLNGKKGRLVKEARKLEQLLLKYKTPDKDPLKYLKVSDTGPFDHTGCFQKLTNHSRTESDKEGVYVWAETARPGEQVTFTWQSCFAKHDKSQWLNQWDEASVWMMALNLFHKPLIEAQQRYPGINPAWQKMLKQAYEQLEHQRAAFICLGKHTGAEVKTLSGVRRIKVRTKDGWQTRSSGTTFWMDEHNLPLGWAYITLDENDRLLQQIKRQTTSWTSADV